jgi:hypothetical protein
MSDLCRLIWCALIGLFRSRAALEAEILVLRHQLNVLRRKSPKRLAFSNIDRLVFAGLCRVAPGVLDALKIFNPQTVIRWHRAGFRAYWRWKSRPHGGRPKTPADIRQLIRDMSIANPLWGAPRIHGELLKLGIDVGQTTVAKYMARRRQPPSQGWKTFLRNHAAPSAQFLPKILQRGSYAPIAAQGRANPACRPECRPHAGDASSRRTAPPIFQSVSFRQGQGPETPFFERVEPIAR